MEQRWDQVRRRVSALLLCLLLQSLTGCIGYREAEKDPGLEIHVSLGDEQCVLVYELVRESDWFINFTA